jgi:UDP-2,3-diacylglucosamine hydrolase
MKIIFIADCHLKGLDDPNQAALTTFLDGLFKIDKLVILGDFFDFWVGLNNIVYEQYKPVLKSLFALSESGVEIIYVEGNHDFDMGPYFTETLKAKVYDNTCGLLLDGKRIYMAHGDTINMTTSYQIFRALLRGPLLKFLKVIIPPPLAWDIGKSMSSGSRGYGKKDPSLEVAQKIFAKEKLKSGFDGVILGHSHAAGFHDNFAGDSSGFYANPGGWVNDKSFLVYEDGEFNLRNYVVRTDIEEELH